MTDEQTVLYEVTDESVGGRHPEPARQGKLADAGDA